MFTGISLRIYRCENINTRWRRVIGLPRVSIGTKGETEWLLMGRGAEECHGGGDGVVVFLLVLV
jgi:hypothetical protein